MDGELSEAFLRHKSIKFVNPSNPTVLQLYLFSITISSINFSRGTTEESRFGMGEFLANTGNRDHSCAAISSRIFFLPDSGFAYLTSLFIF